MVDHLRTRAEFEQCLRTNDDGETTAEFNGLNLRSVYQPIFRRNGTVVGFEALIRAVALDGSHVCPAHLFRCIDQGHPDFANQISIDKLARVIHLRNFAKYAGQHWVFLNMLPSYAVASIETFSNQNLMVQRLAEMAIPREHVVLEVVEHLHSDSVSLSAATNQSIKNGFRIAVDDYGVEGSEEARVRMLRPNIIKIDRSLVQSYVQGEVEAILRSIALAKEVGAELLVEGIENQEEYDAMKALNIAYYQGFHLGMPQPLSEYFDTNPFDFSQLRKAT
ncbi:EAL domain-containing protein [Enterovibrio nigricans]|uniref:EAL domain, c-di-GMP-specific phosphodiesterase class I (Or its enzymatically inactive variant) n=1 Tax=Enterovibrio nigricans DSM 22720 TaxID=1121868 RepID=A0A1T4UHS8_9GAMM|nr:EAL domain-containing protein [Enterovibrio nigricans]SKA52305.1 EAL domain, c-di-GMP-specific phosphodiesterase class I (or its enzymatically inactive variant) [Enterovibrio nigricans DSM 22720]